MIDRPTLQHWIILADDAIKQSEQRTAQAKAYIRSIADEIGLDLGEE